MKAAGMVPVFYHQDVALSTSVIQACYEAGVRVFEFTNRGDNAYEVFCSLVSTIHQEMPEMAIGIGSVVDDATAALYLEAGADFIVSPILNESIARLCNRRKVLWIPGCATLSEISKAEALGAELVKLFPGNVLGPEFVKAVLGPCPWSSLMPTGGVTPEEDNLRDWFNSGVHCVGMGSKLFSEELIHDQAQLTVKIREVVELIERIRA